MRTALQRITTLRLHITTAMASSSTKSSKQIVIDPFAAKAFTDSTYAGYLNTDPVAFETKLNELFEDMGHPLVDGYAPFCKHFFVKNFIGPHVKTPIVAITPENQHLLQSDYEARTDEELPVLCRWFENVDTPSAEYLDVILYSGEQIVKENAAMGKERTQTAPWGIVSIKPQNSTQELPMQPITMLRNALGKEQGGSGVELVREKYNESVAFWKNHAPVRSTSKK